MSAYFQDSNKNKRPQMSRRITSRVYTSKVHTSNMQNKTKSFFTQTFYLFCKKLAKELTQT